MGKGLNKASITVSSDLTKLIYQGKSFVSFICILM